MYCNLFTLENEFLSVVFCYNDIIIYISFEIKFFKYVIPGTEIKAVMHITHSQTGKHPPQ